MEIKQLKKLKNDLLKFKIDFSGASSSNNLETAAQTIIEAINEQINKPTVDKKNTIMSIIGLLENNNIEEIEKSFPKINYIELKNAVNSKIEVESLDNYTILQLKVIYYMLTNDKENNAIKTNKKESVLNSVKEVVFSNMRTQKLKNI